MAGFGKEILRYPEIMEEKCLAEAAAGKGKTKSRCETQAGGGKIGRVAGVR